MFLLIFIDLLFAWQLRVCECEMLKLENLLYQEADNIKADDLEATPILLTGQ